MAVGYQNVIKAQSATRLMVTLARKVCFRGRAIEILKQAILETEQWKRCNFEKMR